MPVRIYGGGAKTIKDATATAADIRSGKVAYGNKHQRIVGTAGLSADIAEGATAECITAGGTVGANRFLEKTGREIVYPSYKAGTAEQYVGSVGGSGHAAFEPVRLAQNKILFICKKDGTPNELYAKICTVAEDFTTEFDSKITIESGYDLSYAASLCAGLLYETETEYSVLIAYYSCNDTDRNLVFDGIIVRILTVSKSTYRITAGTKYVIGTSNPPYERSAYMRMLAIPISRQKAYTTMLLVWYTGFGINPCCCVVKVTKDHVLTAGAELLLSNINSASSGANRTNTHMTYASYYGDSPLIAYTHGTAAIFLSLLKVEEMTITVKREETMVPDVGTYTDAHGTFDLLAIGKDKYILFSNGKQCQYRFMIFSAADDVSFFGWNSFHGTYNSTRMKKTVCIRKESRKDLTIITMNGGTEEWNRSIYFVNVKEDSLEIWDSMIVDTNKIGNLCCFDFVDLGNHLYCLLFGTNNSRT